MKIKKEEHNQSMASSGLTWQPRFLNRHLSLKQTVKLWMFAFWVNPFLHLHSRILTPCFYCYMMRGTWEAPANSSQRNENLLRLFISYGMAIKGMFASQSQVSGCSGRLLTSNNLWEDRYWREINRWNVYLFWEENNVGSVAAGFTILFYLCHSQTEILK